MKNNWNYTVSELIAMKQDKNFFPPSSVVVVMNNGKCVDYLANPSEEVGNRVVKNYYEKFRFDSFELVIYLEKE